jgi:hypothetical protein
MFVTKAIRSRPELRVMRLCFGMSEGGAPSL